MKTLLSFAIVFGILLTIYSVQKKSSSDNLKNTQLDEPSLTQQNLSKEALDLKQKTSPEASVSALKTSGQAKKSPFLPKNKYEASAYKIAQVLGTTLGNPQKSSSQLMEEMENLGLEPLASREKSLSAPTIIRSSNSLAGTRYFHGQIFKSDEGTEHVQYLAFEFAPGPNAFERMKELALSQIDEKIISEIHDEKMHVWKLANGYNVWVKILQKTDMDNDPFNAYSEKDLGTVRVVIEQDVHPQDQHDAHL